MNRALRSLFNAQQSGLILVILLLGAVLTLFADSHEDKTTHRMVNNFLNSDTLMQTATDASFFAIMAVGATMAIISGGIDLSVGSTSAWSAVAMAMVLRGGGTQNPWLGAALCVAIGLLCGLLNGAMVVGLRVHPFIITLGTMWALRGIAFVISKAETISLADA